MKQRDRETKSKQELRKRAEDRLSELLNPAQSDAPATLPSEKVKALLHDLQVHQIELELQNEELRATQARLSLSHEEYLDLYERAPVGYCTLSPEGLFLRANRQTSDLLGTEPKTLLGQNLSHFVVSEDQDRLHLLLRRLQHKGVSEAAVLRVKRTTGGPISARVEAESVEELDGRLNFRAVLSDITKEKLAEDAVELNAKLDSLDSLSAGIAHDFNNLLAGMLGFVNLAKLAADDPQRVVQYLTKAESVFDRARKLTHQLLAFSKRNEPQTRVLALAPLVEKAASFILSGSETSYQLICDEHLWPAQLDDGLIGQLVDNLVLNASQAMGGQGCVHIALHNLRLTEGEQANLPAGDYLSMTVQDEGSGIPKALLTRVFDPFFTTKSTGHGLGLASAGSIVRKHGGALWAESVEGQGSTFHVILPALQGGAYHENPSHFVEHHGSGTILVMDDEDFNLEVMTELLKSLGYEVLATNNGEQALLACSSHTPLRAAFLDLTIKGGRGGKDTVGPLLEKYPGLPVFAMSGYSEDPVLAHPENFGFAGGLEKPYRKHEISALLSLHLGEQTRS